MLTNGARYYVDHAHPELSTPECADPLSIVLYDRAAELILVESMRQATGIFFVAQQEGAQRFRGLEFDVEARSGVGGLGLGARGRSA